MMIPAHKTWRVQPARALPRSRLSGLVRGPLTGRLIATAGGYYHDKGKLQR
jgi:hypothetical protein